MTKDYGDTNFITGLRAVAAIAVVLLHAGGAGLREMGAAGAAFVEMAGRGGVYVFFVISGFSVSASYLQAPSYGAYLNRRFWRIAPPYYFWIAVVALGLVPPAGWVEIFKVPVDAYNVLLHVSFLSFLDYRIADSIIGVEWSLPIEMFYYLLIPMVLVRVRNWMQIALLVAGSYGLYRLGLSNLSRLPVKQEFAGLAFMWSPLPYVFCFALGIAAFRIRERFAAPGWAGDLALLGSAAAILALAFKLNVVVGALRTDFVLFSAATFAIIALGSRRALLTNALLSNRPVQYLGLISYSLYLSHSAVLHMLGAMTPANLTVKFAVVLALTILVSAATYVLIEKPGQNLGKRFERRPREKAA